MAGNRIKGITIEIDGNTTKLNDSLKSVDKQLRTTQNNLRDVNKLLKLDPGNTELLAQKQKNLQTAIQSTQDRLKELKSVQKDSVSAEEWDALQREIAETEQKLEGLKKEYNDFGSVAGQKIQAAGQSIKEFGGKVENAGKKIMPASAAVAGIGVAAIGAAKEVDKGYDTIITKTGATGKTLDGLKGQMDGVFAELPTDAETAGAAIGEVNTRFHLTGETLGEVSKDFIRFAEINNTDVNSSIDNVDAIMKKFGIDTKDTESVLGLMTDAGHKTGISMDTLEGTLQKNGATLKEMGLGLGESINLLASFEANGIDSSTAMTALKKAQQNATKSGKSLDQALKEGVYSIKNASSETDALNTATKLFGAKGAAEMTQAIREGRFSVDDLSASLGDYKDTVKNTYEATLDPWDQMKVAVNNLMIAGNELAGALFETLAPIIEEVVEKVKAFTEWFKSLNDNQKEAIVKIGLIVAAAGPLVLTIGKAISGIGGLVTGIGKFIGFIPGAVTAIGTLITTFGPLLVGGAVIAGVIAGAVLLVKNWDKVTAGAKKMWEGVKRVGSDMARGVKQTWTNITTGTKTALSTARTAVANGWNAIKTNTSSAWNTISSAVATGASNMKSKLQSGMQSASMAVQNAFSSMKTSASNALTALRNAVTNAFHSIKVPNPFNGLLNAARNVASSLRNIFKSLHITMPSIKLPHISVSWQTLLGSGGFSLKIPKLSVRWYKKAYENPMMFTRPTVMQTPYGAKGFGDGSGAEVVLGMDKLRQLVGGASDNITINVYANENMNVKQLAQQIQYELAAAQRQKELAYA